MQSLYPLNYGARVGIPTDFGGNLSRWVKFCAPFK
jgi:hypothetical protein